MKNSARKVRAKRTASRYRGERPGDLLNLGPASERMLRAAGIRSGAELRKLGPVSAYVAVEAAGQKPSLNLLYALAGALSGTHWAKLSADERAALLIAYDASRDKRRGS